MLYSRDLRCIDFPFVPAHVGFLVFPPSPFQLLRRLYLLSVEGHVVEHVEEHFLRGLLQEGRRHLKLVREFQGHIECRIMDVCKVQTVVLEGLCLEFVLLFVSGHRV